MFKKIRLRRRLSSRRSTRGPYVFGLIFAVAAGFLLWKMLKKTPPPKQEKIVFSTWSQFNETKRLQMLLQGFAVKSIVDIPCVDAKKVHFEELGIENYIGVLKERDAAGVLQAQYGSSNASFIDLDVTVDILPKVDLILCWDYLCTLSENEIRSALLQFKRSGANFLLMRHFPEIRNNEEKISGFFQPINWKLPPHYFPEPMIHIMESGEHGTESLALWNMRDLP